MKKWVALCSVLCLCAYNVDAFAAAARTTKQSAVQKGTKVRTKAETTGLYDQECYDLYYGCMDQFCITDNANGGSCGCSDKSIALQNVSKQLRLKRLGPGQMQILSLVGNANTTKMVM